MGQANARRSQCLDEALRFFAAPKRSIGCAGPRARDYIFKPLILRDFQAAADRRPWSAAYSSASAEAAAGSPIFLAVNQMISALWTFIFLAQSALGNLALFGQRHWSCSVRLCQYSARNLQLKPSSPV
jgi:hypothetical protein